MKISRLLLYFHSIEEESVLHSLEGLQEVAVHMPYRPFSSSWLSAFTVAHPHLNKLRIIDERQLYFLHQTPFMSSFVRDCHSRDLIEHFVIKRVGLSRATGVSSQEWHLTAITIVTTVGSCSLLELLRWRLLPST
ncbi:hypothetical protein GYMLUDRAFT_896644 [Collybiopsis luxurians FD-317 M1]|uniref:Unplaced genomic scaffold GYMLUscaffold_66, whole genome shotgun sequence n=1 Tax=Collybiopsis luxurians FD-317 M1 TaxID=944289 RepID=A0A0D0BXS3_9AGAR|nr:hypothetical protein GYMLUDRAFT_896644 [Collybiopsis luxurians FD-317 M1]